MNRKHRITAVLITLVVAVLMAAFVTPAAAQSVDSISTSLSDESGDGLDDRVTVDVTVSNVNSGQTTVELGENNFDVDVSPTDTTDGNQEQFVSPQDTDGDGTPEAVQFTGIGTVSATYTVVADLSGQSDGDTGNVQVSLAGGTTSSASYTVSGGGTTPPPGGATAERIVRATSPDNRIFLGEENVDESAGVFAGVSPAVFERDGVPLEIDDGTVVPDQDPGTYTNPNTGATVQVREPRVERVRFIDPQPTPGERLDAEDTSRIEQGDNNLQVAIDYNYYPSTKIDTTGMLEQDDNDVTNIYLDDERDRGVRRFNQVSGSQVTAADNTDYDAVYTFSIDDTGEYTVTAAPLTGDDRPDNRDVGFDNREEVEQSAVITVIDDEDITLELGQTEANQGDRVDYEIVGALEGRSVPLTIDADDLRFDDFPAIVDNYNSDPRFTIGGDNPVEFASSTFRLTDEGENQGLIFRVGRITGTNAAADPLDLAGAGFSQRDLLILDTESGRVYNTDGAEVTNQLNTATNGVLDLEDGGADWGAFSQSLNGGALTLERVYGVVTREDGVMESQIDAEKLDDTGVDVEVFARDGNGIDADPNTATGLGNVLTVTFGSSTSFAQDEDEESIDVEEAEISIDSPPTTYVPGTEVDISGSITGAVDGVEVFVRDRDNYFLVTTVETDREDGSYEEEDFDLADEAFTQPAQDIVGQPGVYRYGVIDGIDVDIVAAETGDDVRGEVDPQEPDGLDSSDFNAGASNQQSLRVAEPSLEGSFETYDGRVYKPDGVDITGELIGPREYLVLFVDDRGNTVLERFTADEDDGEIEEDDLDLSDLRDGSVSASILSPGRDLTFGDGSFRISEDLQDATGLPASPNANIDNFITIAEALGDIDRTQTQVREILLDQTVEQAGSDDLIVGEEFRISDDSRTQITGIVPGQLRNNLTGIHPIEVGETMVVRGTTNRNPEDATIVVEAEEGPSVAELGTDITDEWGTDGVWEVEIEVSEEVEPGEYVMRSDDGERIDEQTVEILAEGTLEEGERLRNEAEELRQQVEELEGELEAVRGERDELQQQVSELESTNSDLQDRIDELESQQQQDGNMTDDQPEDDDTTEEEGQPGFTAVAALVALVAVALLALRRREE